MNREELQQMILELIHLNIDDRTICYLVRLAVDEMAA